MKMFGYILFLTICLFSALVEAKKTATIQEMAQSLSESSNKKKGSWLSYGASGLYGQDISNDDFQLNSRSMPFYVFGAYAGIKISRISLDYQLNYSVNKQSLESSRYGFTDLSGKVLYSGVKLNILMSKSNSLGFIYYLTSQYSLDNSFQNTSSLVLDTSKSSYSIQINQKVYGSLGLLFDYTVLNHKIDDPNSALTNSVVESNRISIGLSYFN